MPELPATRLQVSHIPAGDLQAVAWKNGGGVTREIAAHPPGASFESFLWRISMADVATEGAFSSFEGIDRVLTVLEGGTMILADTAADIRHSVRPFEPFRFSGETSIYAQLPDGPIRDFNLMCRRGSTQGSTDVRRTAARLGLDTGSTVLHCACGVYRISTTAPIQTYLLHPGDTLVLTMLEQADCHIDITPQSQEAILLDSRIRTI